MVLEGLGTLEDISENPLSAPCATMFWETARSRARSRLLIHSSAYDAPLSGGAVPLVSSNV